MLTFRPSDIKMAKNMMDGPVLGCFASVFGTVRHKIAQKVVGRSVVAFREVGAVFSWVECRVWRSLHSLRSVEMTERNPVEMTERNTVGMASYQQYNVLKNNIFVDK